MFGFWLVVLAVAAWFKRPQLKREVRLLYRRGELVNDYAVFSCGCRFNYANPAEPPTICQAHKAIIDAEVAA